MTDFILWLLTVEALGLAAWPLAAYLFRGWPDKGYGLTKPLGMLLVAFLNWWLGSTVGAANYPALLWVLAILLAVGGALLYRFGLAELPADRRRVLITAGIEEAVFLVAFLFWTYVRSRNPDIYATEKPMDFMLLQVSGLTHHFPPPDAWLSGHTVNYYYLGYAIFAMLGNMSGVDARFGFDLSNITIFALGCSGGYAITLALTRSRLWGFAGAFAVMLAGDIDGFVQTVNQAVNGGLSLAGLNLWCSTRIIDGGCTNYHTITEFPIFSVLWNDLHPHVMALPFALLAIGLAVHAMLDPIADPDPHAGHYLRLVLTAVILGALFPINSWDYPTYLVLVVVALLVADYRRGLLTWRPDSLAWWRALPTWRRGWENLAVIPASLVLYLPYFLTVHSKTGIGFVRNPSSIGEVLDVIGGPLIPMIVFVLWRAVASLAARPARDPSAYAEPSLLDRLPAGWGWWLAAALALLLFALPDRTDVLFLIVLVAAGYVMRTRTRAEAPELLIVLGLAFLGTLLLLLSDFAYLRDNFDNSANYRMNTVFKLYYQAWLLLAAGAPAAIAAITRALRRADVPRSAGNTAALSLGAPGSESDAATHVPVAPGSAGVSPAPRGAGRAVLGVWCVAVGLLALVLAVYPVRGVASQGSSLSGSIGLDGLAYLQLLAPDDYQAVVWIRQHLPADAVIAEADGTALAGDSRFGSCIEYWVCGPDVAAGGAIFDRISALTGRPTLIGWPGSHENLWRGVYGSDPDLQAQALIASRESDVRTLYATPDVKVAQAILLRDHVQYVYVGPVERLTYVDRLNNPPSVLTKFGTFLKPVLTLPGAVLYQVVGQ